MFLKKTLATDRAHSQKYAQAIRAGTGIDLLHAIEDRNLITDVIEIFPVSFRIIHILFDRRRD